MVAVDEKVERVDVTVADGPGAWRALCDELGCRGEVVSPDGDRLVGEACEEVGDVGTSGVVGEDDVESVDAAAVNGGGCFGEEVGETAKQGGCLANGGGGIEAGEQWLPVGVIHQAPRPAEVFGWSVGGADRGD